MASERQIDRLPGLISYFILAVPMRVRLGKYSCMSSSFLITMLNGTCSFPTVQAQVHIIEIRCEEVNVLHALVNLCFSITN